MRSRVCRPVLVPPLIISLSLAGCSLGGSGTALARQACHHVVSGLASYDRAAADNSPQASSADQTDALDQFRQALPLASQAALNDGQWQALMTTLQDASRVPVADLVTALERDCSLALGKTVR